MKWQPIETAPKDGSSIVLYCESVDSHALDCVWKNGEWKVWELDGFDVMNYCSLPPYMKPTHWFKIVPPNEDE